MAPQLVPSRGAVLLNVTSKGRHSVLQKADQTVEALLLKEKSTILPLKVHYFIFYVNLKVH